MTRVASFEVHFSQFLNHLGELVQPLPEWAVDPLVLVPFYRSMTLARTFDAKAIALQRTGQLGTYASVLGAEAIGVGVPTAMQRDDVLLPTYRESAMVLHRGVSMSEILSYWSGDERGSLFEKTPHDFPFCITIAAQCCHAVGVAYACKIKRLPRVTVCMVGDGGTSKGDFYEAINAAGLWRLPLVFVINNNKWAISVPLKSQTAAQTLAQKAIAGGFMGEQVDGNDVIAVHDCLRRAIAKARDGGGPILIEAISYRLCDHTTSDDATRYREARELAEHWTKEPILRLRRYLMNARVWSEVQEEALLKECVDQVNQAVAQMQALDPPVATAMFDHLYAVLPASLGGQRAEVSQRGSGG